MFRTTPPEPELTLATMNWKSAPTTQMQNAGKVKAQYESPCLWTAARVNEVRYAPAPIPTSSLLETLC
jgi:hypothetical protein